MIGYTLRRVLSAVPLLLIVSLFVFLLLDLMPGDAAAVLAGDSATLEQIEETRRRLLLDEPFPIRYGQWLLGAVQGDLGTSLFSSQSVTATVMSRMPVTASLGLVAMSLVLIVGLPLGILAARHPDSAVDRVLTSFASLSMAIPPFVLGLVLVLAFAIALPWFPPIGYVSLQQGGFGDWLHSLILPAIAVAAIPIAELARQTRGALVDTMSQDYIRTIRSKGGGESRVLQHALKNAGVPIMTVLGLQVNRVLGGAVIVEFVFALPGFGALAISSVLQRDVPVILGVVMTSALIVVVVNLITDLSYGLFNPRLRV